MKNRILVFALVLFAVLAVGLEFVCRYHFFFLEQGQMFLFSGEYFADVVSVPAGLTVWMTRFFVQFFAIPWAGSIITALLLTGVGTLTALVCRRMAPGSVPLYLLWALPVVSLLLMHLNFYYHFEGTVAFLFMLTALWIYVGLKKPGRRLAAGLISAPLLYWLCGPVALPYALCVVIWELANKTPRWYLSLLVALEVALVGQAVQWLSFIGDWWMAFSPRLYYEEMLVPNPVIMYAWIALPLVLLTARFCRDLKAGSLRREIILSTVQVVLVVFVAWVGVARYFDRASYKMEQLSHLSRTGQWDAIIELLEGPVNNYLHMNYLNLALAQKGLLADNLFKYDQRGPDGLILGWDHMLHRAVILSDINYCIGNVAIAQQIAHEGYVGAAGLGNPRLLQRLVQTNLIFGAWPIAEKYLDILDKTLMYRSWAARHRRFLGDDGAVEAYPEFGEKRKCLPEENFLSYHPWFVDNLEAIAIANPASKTAIEYLGALSLVTKDTGFFSSMLDRFYGTDVLPTLPLSFQEAVVSIHDNDPAMWDRYGVSAPVRERFEAFKSRLRENQAQNGLAGVMRGPYGDTFWFYQMFK